MSVNAKMTAIADEIRTLSGVNDKLNLDSMASNLGDANNEIDTQADLIANIILALEGKISSGSDEGEHECSSGHNYISTVITPTCTESGYTIHTCSNCDEHYIDAFTERTSHNYNNSGVCIECGRNDGIATLEILAKNTYTLTYVPGMTWQELVNSDFNAATNVMGRLYEDIFSINENGYVVFVETGMGIPEAGSLVTADMPVDYATYYSKENGTNILVAPDSRYCYIDDVMFNKDGSVLLEYPTDKLGDYSIPNSVTSIGYAAFEDCRSLTSIVIPDSVTSIGSSAFYNCTSLTSITIPNSVTSIGDYAFYGCTGLTSVTIGNGVTSIGASVFAKCSSLTSVTLPDGVTSIGKSVFYNCTGLTSITIPNSVTSIGDYAFHNCSGLTSITIPNSVTSIGNSAFNGCSSLTSIVIPDGVTSIGDSAFEYCSGLTSITIPNSVTSIGDSAFEDCSSLTSIVIPDGVTSIGDSAFEYCLSLTSATLPDSVTSIGDYAFFGCSGLTSINYSGTITQLQSIQYDLNWRSGIPTGCLVVCKDGTVSITSLPDGNSGGSA